MSEDETPKPSASLENFLFQYEAVASDYDDIDTSKISFNPAEPPAGLKHQTTIEIVTLARDTNEQFEMQTAEQNAVAGGDPIFIEIPDKVIQ